MTKLSVNINKIATLRNARGSSNPNVVQMAQDCERFDADGITIHPRPDAQKTDQNKSHRSGYRDTAGGTPNGAQGAQPQYAASRR